MRYDIQYTSPTNQPVCSLAKSAYFEAKLEYISCHKSFHLLTVLLT